MHLANMKITWNHRGKKLLINGVPIEGQCLSCDFHLEHGMGIVTLRLLCDSFEAEGDDFPIRQSVNERGWGLDGI